MVPSVVAIEVGSVGLVDHSRAVPFHDQVSGKAASFVTSKEHTCTIRKYQVRTSNARITVEIGRHSFPDPMAGLHAFGSRCE